MFILSRLHFSFQILYHPMAHVYLPPYTRNNAAMFSVFLLNVNVITNKFAYNLYGLKNPYLLHINIVVE